MIIGMILESEKKETFDIERLWDYHLSNMFMLAGDGTVNFKGIEEWIEQTIVD